MLYKSSVSVNPWSAAWRPDGSIVQYQFYIDQGIGVLVSVSDQGGQPVTVATPDSVRDETILWFPHVMPDGETIAVVARKKNETSDLILLKDSLRKSLLHTNPGESLLTPVYAPSGFLIYQRNTTDGRINLWAIQLEPNKYEPLGEPFIVAQDASNPSVSSDGTLVFLSGNRTLEKQLVWVDREGRITGSIGQPKPNLRMPALSPDDGKVAVVANDQSNSNIWTYDAIRGIPMRLTYDDNLQVLPAWSPDGKELVFTSSSGGGGGFILLRMRSDGNGSVQPLLPEIPSTIGFEPDWSHDGRYVVYRGGNSDLMASEIRDGAEPFVLMQTDHSERVPALSPDGNYVAYQSNQSGGIEVYVSRFPSGEGKWQISTGGGRRPRWNGDGSELFYIKRDFVNASGSDQLMVVPVMTDSTFHPGIPQSLFAAETVGVFDLTDYDVSSDGKRFVIAQPVNQGEPPLITVVQNWYAEFKDK